MSKTSTDKTVDEQYVELFAEFRKMSGRSVRMRDFARWIKDNEKMNAPTVDIVSAHARRAKNAIRRQWVRDLCGRQIQPVVAVIIEKMTAGGQTVLDVVYDYLHEMSLDHALTHFEQKDKNMGKQRRATTRNLQSCLEFNPNLKGHEADFSKFLFILEEPEAIVEEVIEESAVITKALPETLAAFPSEAPSGVSKERRERDDKQPR